MRDREARALALRDRLVRATGRSSRELRRRRGARHPHSAKLTDITGAAGCGHVDRRAPKGAVRRWRVNIEPGSVETCSARWPGRRCADDVCGLAREPHVVAIAIEVDSVIASAGHE